MSSDDVSFRDHFVRISVLLHTTIWPILKQGICIYIVNIF